ncbi:MAG: radical SAM protein [archaeon]
MGKEYSSYLKLREPEFCYYPLHLDPYGSGCFHNCKYCFQKDQLYFRNEKDEENKTRKPTAWHPQEPSVSPIKKIKRSLQLGLSGEFFDKFKNESTLEAHALIYKKLPLRIGGVTDPFQPIEKKERVTYQIMKLLNENDYPALIFTKSNLITEDKYMNLLKEKKENYYVQFTITTLDTKLARLIETNAPSPEKRLAALKELNQIGIETAVRINPLYPKKVYDIIGEDMYDFLKEIKKVGTNTIIVGGLRVQSKTREYGPIASAEFMNDAFAEDERFTNFDIKEFMNKDSSTYYIEEEKLYHRYKEIKEIADDLGMEFSICHDNNKNADKKRFRDLWYNKEDCCNAYGKIKGFKNKFAPKGRNKYE